MVTQLRFVTSNSGYRADVALDNINVVSNIPENTTYLWTTDATNGNSGWSHTDSIDISISSACNTSHNGTYTLTVTDAIGCVASDNVNIIVNPCTEYSSGGSISGAETICEGFNPIDISSNSLPSGGSGGLTSYQWQYSSDNSNWINVNGVTSESYDLNTISSTTFYRRGAYRCNINGIKYSNTISKIVNPAPNVNAGLDEMVCIGDSLVLSANGANSYTWNNGVTNLVSFVPSSTTYYVVEGIDGNGCTKKDSLLVEVNSFPIVDAGVDQTTSTGLPLNLFGSTNLNTASGNFEEFILSGSDDAFEYSLSGNVLQNATNVRIGNRTGHLMENVLQDLNLPLHPFLRSKYYFCLHYPFMPLIILQLQYRLKYMLKMLITSSDFSTTKF